MKVVDEVSSQSDWLNPRLLGAFFFIGSLAVPYMLRTWEPWPWMLLEPAVACKWRFAYVYPCIGLLCLFSRRE